MSSLGTAKRQRFRFGDLTLDPGRRRVTRGHEQLDVNGLTFDLLHALVLSWPDVATYDDLARRVWQRQFVSPENVAQRVMMLRQALSDDAAQPRYIEAVRTKGYRLLPAVEAMPAEPSPPRSPYRARWWSLAAAAGMALVVATLSLTPRGSKPPRLPSSVAVLPFESLSPDPDDAYFAAAIHEEIIGQLQRFGGINVIARASTQPYADTRKTIEEVAEELDVETLLEGSVRYTDRRVRLAATLIDPATGMALWSGVYDRDLVDVFAAQEDIAANIALALGAEFAAALPRRQRTASTEAAALYLQVVDMQRRASSDPTGLLDTVRRNPVDSETQHRYLDRALALDPGFAAAYAAKATIYALSLDARPGGRPDEPGEAELAALALHNAQKTLELDPGSTEAYLAMAIVHRFHWRWGEAASAFARAFERSPLDVDAANGYGALLSWAGKHDEALPLIERATRLNPGPPPLSLGMALTHAGRTNEAVAVLRRAAAQAPANPQIRHWLAIAEGLRGNPSAAVRALRTAERLAGDDLPLPLLAGVAYSYSQLDRTEDVERILGKYERLAAEQRVDSGTWALVHLARGQPEPALDWLRRAVDRTERNEPGRDFVNLLTIKTNVHRNALLDEPRFRELRDRMGGID